MPKKFFPEKAEHPGICPSFNVRNLILSLPYYPLPPPIQGEDDDEKNDYKRPPAVGEEHGETEGEYEGIPANSLHPTKHLP